MTAPADVVRARQEAFYADAEARRFTWLTEHPMVRRAERTLLGRLDGLHAGAAILEVGCGEGANFATLQASGVAFRYTGFDCFPAKIAFCRREHPAGRFLVADARHAFPFRDESHDCVLIRDLLHHLAERDRAHVLHESLRVLVPEGRLWIVEGNARNLIGRGFALLFPHERCMLETQAPLLQSFVAHTLSGHPLKATMEEPSNVFRLICHYQLGFPALGRSRVVDRLLQAWERTARAWRPPTRWAYTIIEVRKAAPAARRQAGAR